MRTKFVSLAASLAALVTLGTTQLAQASSHREAPGTSKDPVADNTDVWAWNEGDATSGTLHMVVSYNPFEEPAGGPNFHSFGDDVLYEIHVARGSANLNDVVTYQFRFTNTPYNPLLPAAAAIPGTPDQPIIGGQEFFTQLSGSKQTYTVTQVINGVSTVIVPTADVAPANIGPRTNQYAYGLAAPYDKATYEAFALTKIANVTGGGKVWAGPRDDGFYVDLGGVFDLAGLRPAGAAQDGVSGFNAHTISLDVPFSTIPAAPTGGTAKPAFANRLGIWASASRRKMSVLRNDGTKQSFGPWVQVSRLGLPLINEVIVGLQDKDKFNRTQPKDDVANFGGYILAPTIVRDAKAVGIYTALGVDDTTYAVLSGKTAPRFDIIKAINVLADPDTDGTGGPDTFPLGATGDVLRVDFNAPAGFPNGRPLGSNATKLAANQEQDVTDVLSTIVLAGLQNFVDAVTPGGPAGLLISDGVGRNDANYTNTMPYLATPWTGATEGHGKPTP